MSLGESEKLRELQQQLAQLKTENKALAAKADDLIALEKKRQEEAIKKSDAFLAAVFSSIQDGMCVLDSELRIMQVNPIMEQTHGNASEIIGKKCYEIYHNRNEPCKSCPSLRALESGKIESEIVPGPEGTKVDWLELYVYPIVDPETGSTTGVVEFVRNITDRKRAEETVKKLRNYLASVVDSMPSLLVGVDGEGKITQWNKMAAQTTGLSLTSVQGSDVASVFPRLESDMENIKKSIRSQKTYHKQKVPFLTDIGTRYEDITFYPISTNGDQGAVIRIDDVTEQVHLEEAVIQSEKMLSISSLAAGMAHEINNPLGAVMSAAQTIRRRFSPDLKKNVETAAQLELDLNKINVYMQRRDILDYLDGIQEAGERAANIVRNMLEFSRKSESIRVECNIHSVLDKSLELASSDYNLEKQYDFRSIDIRREYDNSLPAVNVIETELSQVFLNLFKNAAQAMAKKEFKDEKPTIVIRTGKTSLGVWISIEDNGLGMEESVRKRVFEPFFTTKPVDEGTGLGLSVSYFIITKNHKGTFLVESSPQQGTKFTIKLPQLR